MHDQEKNTPTPAHHVDIKFNLDQIPEFQSLKLANTVLGMVERLFAQPGEEARYQAWLQERKKKNCHTENGGPLK